MNKHNCRGSIGPYLVLLANSAVNDIYLVTKHVWRGSMFRQLGEGELHRTDYVAGLPRTGRGDHTASTFGRTIFPGVWDVSVMRHGSQASDEIEDDLYQYNVE